jgi:hypothetical protein
MSTTTQVLDVDRTCPGIVHEARKARREEIARIAAANVAAMLRDGWRLVSAEGGFVLEVAR